MDSVVRRCHTVRRLRMYGEKTSQRGGWRALGSPVIAYRVARRRRKHQRIAIATIRIVPGVIRLRWSAQVSCREWARGTLASSRVDGRILGSPRRRAPAESGLPRRRRSWGWATVANPIVHLHLKHLELRALLGVEDFVDLGVGGVDLNLDLRTD